MAAKQHPKVVAFSSGEAESELLMKKAIQLGAQLHLPVELRAFISLNPSNGTYSAEKLNSCLDEFKKMKVQMEEILKEAEKKKIETHASILAAAEPALKPEDKADIIFTSATTKISGSGEQILTYLHFKDSRKTVHLDKSVILAEGELTDPAQFQKLCKLIRQAGTSARIRIVLFEGKSNLIAWQKTLEDCNLKKSTIDILSEEKDLAAYLRKKHTYLICISYNASHSGKRIEELHKLNKSDILLF